MPRALGCLHGPSLGQHVDAYQEYSNLVGRLDGGRLLSGAVFEEIKRRACDGRRRLYVNWRNQNGMDCRAIGPQSMCFCGHRYNEHDWGAFESREVRCKMPGCACRCYNYVPVRGSQDLVCSKCSASFTEHRADHKCPRGDAMFASSYTCSCTGSYQTHHTSIESRTEREAAGRRVDAGWMEQAATEGLPVCHLGGLMGFTSLTDGFDRAMAGLEGDVNVEGAVFDAGANQFLQRLHLEDTVNSVSCTQGKTAGYRALAMQPKRAMPKRPSTESPRTGPKAAQPKVGPGRRADPKAFPKQLGAEPSSGVGLHNGAVPAAPRRAQRGGRSKAAVAPKAKQASRANIHTLMDAGAVPVTDRSGRPDGGGRAASVPPSQGRRLGGARQNNPEAMVRARLALFDS